MNYYKFKGDLYSIKNQTTSNENEKLNLLPFIIYIWASQTLSNVYSVMQSDGNSFGGDVVWDTFNKISRDEDSILNKI